MQVDCWSVRSVVPLAAVHVVTADSPTSMYQAIALARPGVTLATAWLVLLAVVANVGEIPETKSVALAFWYVNRLTVWRQFLLLVSVTVPSLPPATLANSENRPSSPLMFVNVDDPTSVQPLGVVCVGAPPPVRTPDMYPMIWPSPDVVPDGNVAFAVADDPLLSSTCTAER